MQERNHVRRAWFGGRLKAEAVIIFSSFRFPELSQPN